jgi:hypothetical protein
LSVRESSEYENYNFLISLANFSFNSRKPFPKPF